MTASFPPLPDKPEPLSSREQKILAEIEEQLHVSDGRLVDRLADEGWISVRLWVPAWLRSRIGVALALVVLLVGAPLIPMSVWAVIGLLIILVGIPWLLLQGTEGQGRG